MTPLGVAHLTTLELPPAALIPQAARAGFQSVGLRLNPAMPGGIAYPSRAGTAAHLALRRLLREEGVALHEVEFIELTPEVDVPAFAGMLEAAADLGAGCITVSGDDPDPSRLIATFAALCDLAGGFGLRVEIEFMRWRVVGTLDQALRILSGADRANAGLVVDALHLIRSGASAAALRDVPPAWLRSLQLCDAPLAAPPPDGIIAEARTGRLPPGQGGLPLLSILRAMPKEAAVSAEIPLPTLATEARLALAYRATRQVVEASGSA